MQARYAKRCYNEYNECKTLRILQSEANRSRYQFSDEYTFSNDNQILTSEYDEATSTKRQKKEDNAITRSRLIINPDYVSSLDESDGSKPYVE